MRLDELHLKVLDEESVHDYAEELADISNATLYQFDRARLLDALGHLQKPSAHVFRNADGHAIAFKLGYQKEHGLFYSWLGGVLPAYRRKGLAHQLMQHQHEWASDEGYNAVETKARATNNPMIILNLKNGFQIRGVEFEENNPAMVVMHKNLLK